MPFPIAHGLVGASIAALLRPNNKAKQDWRLLFAAACVAQIPDFDFFFVWILGFGREWHRGFMHSIFFALALTFVALAAAKFSRARMTLTLGAALLSHSILDYLTTNEGGGVALLSPFSPARLKLGATSLFETGASSNYLYEVLKSCLIETAVFVPVFLLALLIRRILYREAPETFAVTDSSARS